MTIAAYIDPRHADEISTQSSDLAIANRWSSDADRAAGYSAA